MLYLPQSFLPSPSICLFFPSRLRFFVSFRIFLSLHCLSSCVHVGVCSLTSPPRLSSPTPHKPQFFHPFVFGQSLAKSPICQRVQRSACSKVSADVHSENPATGAKLVWAARAKWALGGASLLPDVSSWLYGMKLFQTPELSATNPPTAILTSHHGVSVYIQNKTNKQTIYEVGVNMRLGGEVRELSTAGPPQVLPSFPVCGSRRRQTEGIKKQTMH